MSANTALRGVLLPAGCPCKPRQHLARRARHGGLLSTCSLQSLTAYEEEHNNLIAESLCDHSIWSVVKGALWDGHSACAPIGVEPVTAAAHRLGVCQSMALQGRDREPDKVPGAGCTVLPTNFSLQSFKKGLRKKLSLPRSHNRGRDDLGAEPAPNGSSKHQLWRMGKGPLSALRRRGPYKSSR